MQISQQQGPSIMLATQQGREAVSVAQTPVTAPDGSVSTAGDSRITVNISQEARDKLAGEQTQKSKESETKESPTIERIKEAIELLKKRLEVAKEQLQEIEGSNMDEEAKQDLLDAKRNEIMQITAELSQANDQLAEARKKEKEKAGG